ncbi:phosphatidylserine synthase [Blattamonas nauphoetae]|uniref:Phosphatidylserine synthase n=1 Tax=Blattamonas nauphoetae TaxID=2049346 RepID=A0ABQ9XXU3_9EUKA|nr:phosphatidylserine synthase [Blattamonas nauphoetae]
MLYVMILTFLLYQKTEDTRQFLRFIDETLTFDPPYSVEIAREHLYSGLCLGDLVRHPLQWILERGVLEKILHWFIAAFIFRDYTILWTILVLVEVVKLLLEELFLIVFEPYIERVVVNIFICGALGIYQGMLTIRRFAIQRMDWSGESHPGGSLLSTPNTNYSYLSSVDGVSQSRDSGMGSQAPQLHTPSPGLVVSPSPYLLPQHVSLSSLHHIDDSESSDMYPEEIDDQKILQKRKLLIERRKKIEQRWKAEASEWMNEDLDESEESSVRQVDSDTDDQPRDFPRISAAQVVSFFKSIWSRIKREADSTDTEQKSSLPDESSEITQNHPPIVNREPQTGRESYFQLNRRLSSKNSQDGPNEANPFQPQDQPVNPQSPSFLPDGITRTDLLPSFHSLTPYPQLPLAIPSVISSTSSSSVGHNPSPYHTSSASHLNFLPPAAPPTRKLTPPLLTTHRFRPQKQRKQINNRKRKTMTLSQYNAILQSRYRVPIGSSGSEQEGESPLPEEKRLRNKPLAGSSPYSADIKMVSDATIETATKGQTDQVDIITGLSSSPTSHHPFAFTSLRTRFVQWLTPWELTQYRWNVHHQPRKIFHVTLIIAYGALNLVVRQILSLLVPINSHHPIMIARELLTLVIGMPAVGEMYKYSTHQTSNIGSFAWISFMVTALEVLLARLFLPPLRSPLPWSITVILVIFCVCIGFFGVYLHQKPPFLLLSRFTSAP